MAGPLPCDETTGLAGPYPCHNVDLLGYLPANLFGGLTTADIWGWTDSATGREYALVSHSTATSFVDISDPSDPILLGELPAPVPNVLWRDVKVYQDHAYIVGDGDFVLPHGLQIFDLTQLRGLSGPPAVFSPTAHYAGIGHSHNFAVNEAAGTGYAVGSNTCSGGLHMLDLSDPANPVFLGCFSADGYTHDVQCVNYHGPDQDYAGREICFASNVDTLTIVDVTDKSAPVMVARQGYAGSSYTHQGSLTEDHAYFILGDETDEQSYGHNTHSYLWDLADLDAPVHFSTYVGPTTAIDHNLFVAGRYVFETNYTAGLRILDSAQIGAGVLSEVAYFDTHPASDVAEFAGAWSNYPFFSSGNVIVSNIEDGLYILKPHLPGSPVQPGESARATGGGWLAASGQQKINFGFQVEGAPEGPEGELQLNDRQADVKIHIAAVTSLGGLSGACGGIPAGENAAEIHGDGTFNGQAASFRVCVSDNGEPGRGVDALYLECTAGCTYATTDSAPDSTIDGGNIQVAAAPAGQGGDPQAATIILAPVLLSEGAAGQLQTYTVYVYDQHQQRMSGASVTLQGTTAGGTITTVTAVTNPSGVAVFTLAVPWQAVEYISASGGAESNTIQVSPILR